MGYYPLTLSACYSRADAKRAATAQKGVPVPGTGKRGHAYGDADAGRSNGVSSGSHVVSHRYADEGDKGKHHRRAIRRLETLAWHAEVWEGLEQYAAGDF